MMLIVQDPSGETGSKDRLRRAALHCIAQRGYAATSSRDIAREAGANVASINYHFGSKEALVTEALGECFGMWNQRVETAFAAIDSFADLRSSVHACIETYAPALRSEELRERMAAGYATVRESAVQLATKAMQDEGMPVPDNLAAITSVLMAVCDGLMLQWIADPEAPPNAAETIDALGSIGALAAMR